MYKWRSQIGRQDFWRRNGHQYPGCWPWPGRAAAAGQPASECSPSPAEPPSWWGEVSAPCYCWHWLCCWLWLKSRSQSWPNSCLPAIVLSIIFFVVAVENGEVGLCLRVVERRPTTEHRRPRRPAVPERRRRRQPASEAVECQGQIQLPRTIAEQSSCSLQRLPTLWCLM